MIDARFAHPYCIESVTDQSSEVQFSPWSVGGDAGQVVSSNVRFLICIFNVDNNKIVMRCYRDIHCVRCSIELPLE